MLPMKRQKRVGSILAVWKNQGQGTYEIGTVDRAVNIVHTLKSSF